MILKKYLWLMPFFSFISGYIIMQQLFRISETVTPHLVGKHVHEILPIITQHNLNLRLITHKEETDLPEGIILNQTPKAGTTIKENQPICIVTTKKPLATRAPQCIGIHIKEITQLLETTDIRPRIYHLPHAYPENICFAQSPQPHEPLEKNRLIIYISSGNNKPIIWPDFTDMPLQNVIEFLNNYNIQPQIINDSAHKNYTLNENYIVIDQRPLAGTLLTLDENKPLSVQLRIR